MRKATIADRLEYAAFASVMAAAGRLSQERAERMGASLGRLAYHRIKLRRREVEEHLRLSFPEQDTHWRDRIAEAAYAHLGRESVAMLLLSRASRADIARRVRHEVGRERFVDAYSAGRGVVLVGGHIGNWELGAASLAAQGMHVEAIYQPQRNPLFDAAVVQARRRLGVELIRRAEASKHALERLRQGAIVCFVSDQNAGRTGIFVPFLGRPASTHRGAALLAVRAGAPLFVGAAVREGDHYQGITQEITTAREGDLDQAVQRLTAAFTAYLEELVRRWPEQYFWHHRRWKTKERP
ncbi:MAG: lysophospholipid acyltransferase family protein [Longimicrobiales bacterium]